MELSRRGLFKAGGAALATTLAYSLTSKNPALAAETNREWKLVDTEESTNICCYCAGGCGSLCSSRDGELINLEGDPDHPINEGGLCPKGATMINLEGDPDHPINEGGLCPKGATMFQLRNVVDPQTHEIVKNADRVSKPMVRRPGKSEWEDITWEDAIAEIALQLRNVVDPQTHEIVKNADRVSKPMVRRPGKSEWEDITWEDAIAEIARHVKDTRDETFIEVDDSGLTVNRCPGIASLGGSQQNSEEEYLILKLMRSLGVVAIDNQARV